MSRRFLSGPETIAIRAIDPKNVNDNQFMLMIMWLCRQIAIFKYNTSDYHDWQANIEKSLGDLKYRASMNVVRWLQDQRAMSFMVILNLINSSHAERQYSAPNLSSVMPTRVRHAHVFSAPAEGGEVAPSPDSGLTSILAAVQSKHFIRTAFSKRKFLRGLNSKAEARKIRNEGANAHHQSSPKLSSEDVVKQAAMKLIKFSADLHMQKLAKNFMDAVVSEIAEDKLIDAKSLLIFLNDFKLADKLNYSKRGLSERDVNYRIEFWQKVLSIITGVVLFDEMEKEGAEYKQDLLKYNPLYTSADLTYYKQNINDCKKLFCIIAGLIGRDASELLDINTAAGEIDAIIVLSEETPEKQEIERLTKLMENDDWLPREKTDAEKVRERMTFAGLYSFDDLNRGFEEVHIEQFDQNQKKAICRQAVINISPSKKQAYLDAEKLRLAKVMIAKGWEDTRSADVADRDAILKIYKDVTSKRAEDKAKTIKLAARRKVSKNGRSVKKVRFSEAVNMDADTPEFVLSKTASLPRYVPTAIQKESSEDFVIGNSYEGIKTLLTNKQILWRVLAGTGVVLGLAALGMLTAMTFGASLGVIAAIFAAPMWASWGAAGTGVAIGVGAAASQAKSIQARMRESSPQSFGIFAGESVGVPVMHHNRHYDYRGSQMGAGR